MRSKLPFYVVLGLVSLASIWLIIKLFSSPTEENEQASNSRMKTRTSSGSKGDQSADREGLIKSTWGAKGSKDRFGRDLKARAQIDNETQNLKTLFEQGDLSVVKERLDKLLADNPNVPEYVAMLGDYYLALDDYASAEKTVRKLLELDPKNLFARETLSRTLAVRGNLEEAREEIFRVLRDNPGSESAMRKVLTYADMSGSPEHGVEDLRGMIADNPQNGNAYVVLAEKMAEMGNSEEAFNLSLKGAENDPENPGNHRILSIQYALKGDVQNSLVHSRYWSQFETNPQYKPAADLNYLERLEFAGNKAEAYEFAMNVDSDDPELQAKAEEIIKKYHPKNRTSKR